ncbi:MAG TPA: 3-phosphoshikimate 1-carboxyvinyltransferase [Gemmataceae bacterium]|jgi:3-phosphoshikimate 1-carboxyvinyltransferase|nr:3-phosphoshikimate 1-carboxyvinyltransferase [Gemmataceae bacterium]
MSQLTYPDQLEMQPYAGPPLSANVTVPGSKSITNRALVLAALGSWGCKLSNALRSEDTEVMVDCLRRLGFDVRTDWPNCVIDVSFDPAGDFIPASSANLFVGNSGTTVRFLTAMLALGKGVYRLDGVPRMRERPIQDLLDGLRQLKVDAESESGNGCPPVVIRAAGLSGGHVSVRGDVSSQFLSGLLLVLPCAEGDTTIDVASPLVSKPYVEMTVAMLRQFGLETRAIGSAGFIVPGNQIHKLESYFIEPDASAASYFWAAAAILGGRVTVAGLTDQSLQGDVAFVDILQQMSCRVEKCDAGITVHGRPLRGIDVDMNAISDTVMTLGAVACFAEGPTRIRNVAHIRHKETDRISALATELRRLGAEVEEFADGLTIHPRPLHGATVETYNDHRMAMSLALIGLKVPGVIIKNPACVAKTYPGFWQDLDCLTHAR